MTARAVQIFVNDHLFCLDVFKTNDVIYFSYIGRKICCYSKFFTSRLNSFTYALLEHDYRSFLRRGFNKLHQLIKSKLKEKAITDP